MGEVMRKFNVNDRVYVSAQLNWDATVQEDSPQVSAHGWTGTITDVWDDDYGVLLENDPWHRPACFSPDELRSLSEWDSWVSNGIPVRTAFDVRHFAIQASK